MSVCTCTCVSLDMINYFLHGNMLWHKWNQWSGWCNHSNSGLAQGTTNHSPTLCTQFTHMHSHTHIHAPPHTHTQHACMHTHTTCMHAHTHTHTHTYHIHSHTHFHGWCMCEVVLCIKNGRSHSKFIFCGCEHAHAL